MDNLYTGLYTTHPIGKFQENTNYLRAVNMHEPMKTSPNPSSFYAEKIHASDFAQAIYRDGPHSLLFPNIKSQVLAQNIDYIV
jgi:hypothetical protein